VCIYVYVDLYKRATWQYKSVLPRSKPSQHILADVVIEIGANLCHTRWHHYIQFLAYNYQIQLYHGLSITYLSVIIDPFMSLTTSGVGANGIDSLFNFGCFISTTSPCFRFARNALACLSAYVFIFSLTMVSCFHTLLSSGEVDRFAKH